MSTAEFVPDQACRFCLHEKSKMNRLEWSKWPSAEITRTFQLVVGQNVSIYIILLYYNIREVNVKYIIIVNRLGDGQ